MTIEQALAQNIRTLRKQAGMSQAELAEAAGVSLNTISRVETEKQVPHTDNLERIAGALGVKSSTLFFDPSSKVSDFAFSPWIGIDPDRPDVDALEARLRALEKVAFPDVAPELDRLRSRIRDLEKENSKLQACISRCPQDILNALPHADEGQLFLIRSALDLEGGQESEESDEDAG